jgi:hypothetical protein
MKMKVAGHRIQVEEDLKGVDQEEEVVIVDEGPAHLKEARNVNRI